MVTPWNWYSAMMFKHTQNNCWGRLFAFTFGVWNYKQGDSETLLHRALPRISSCDHCLQGSKFVFVIELACLGIEHVDVEWIRIFSCDYKSQRKYKSERVDVVSLYRCLKVLVYDVLSTVHLLLVQSFLVVLSGKWQSFCSSTKRNRDVIWYQVPGSRTMQ